MLQFNLPLQLPFDKNLLHAYCSHPTELGQSSLDLLYNSPFRNDHSSVRTTLRWSPRWSLPDTGYTVLHCFSSSSTNEENVIFTQCVQTFVTPIFVSSHISSATKRVNQTTESAYNTSKSNNCSCIRQQQWDVTIPFLFCF